MEEAHDIADHLEKRIEEELLGADATIHIEPCLLPDCPGRERCPSERARLGKPDRKDH